MWILTRPRCSKALLKLCAFGCASRSRASDRAIEHPVSLHLVERQCELSLCAPSTERCCLFLHLLHFPPPARVNDKIDVSWCCFREVHREGTKRRTVEDNPGCYIRDAYTKGRNEKECRFLWSKEHQDQILA